MSETGAQDIVLESGTLRLALDPIRGAEIRSLVATDDHVELLFQAPWRPAPLGRGPLDEAAWEAAWRGGWQVLFLNAGVPCTVEGRLHGFHGEASVSAWRVMAQAPGSVQLAWDDESGLAIERSLELAGTSLVVRTQVANRADAARPFILVEHIVLGGRLADSGVRLDLPGGSLQPQSWAGEPLVPLSKSEAWPIAVVAGRQEDWSSLGGAPLSRFGVVVGLPDGRARIVNGGGCVGVEVTWDAAALPHLWLWQERYATRAQPWGGRTACLAVEPASTRAADGLAGALERGDALLLEPGASVETWVRLELLRGSGR